MVTLRCHRLATAEEEMEVSVAHARCIVIAIVGVVFD